jgi:membrane protein YqaA with SNARE-associated domain
MELSIQAIFQVLSIPWVGLSSVGLFAFLSSTLLPLSSEVPFYAYLANFPQNTVQLLAVASIGNTLGGCLNWWLGRTSRKFFEDRKKSEHPKLDIAIQKFGAKALLFSWAPLLGDPLTALAGWCQLEFTPCFIYMFIGKFLRYVVIVGIYFSMRSS